MFCGILPWTWFSSSLLESSGVLISGGNLIKKVLFPAEVLPIVTVLANMVHFFFGLAILAAFLIYYQRPLHLGELAWFPVVVLVQLRADARLRAAPVGADRALPRHPRHPVEPADVLVLRDADHLPVFPVRRRRGRCRQLLNSTRSRTSRSPIRRSCSSPGPVGHLKWLLVLGVASPSVFFLFGYFVFDRLRDYVRRGR